MIWEIEMITAYMYIVYIYRCIIFFYCNCIFYILYCCIYPGIFNIYVWITCSIHISVTYIVGKQSYLGDLLNLVRAIASSFRLLSSKLILFNTQAVLVFLFQISKMLWQQNGPTRLFLGNPFFWYCGKLKHNIIQHVHFSKFTLFFQFILVETLKHAGCLLICSFKVISKSTKNTGHHTIATETPFRQPQKNHPSFQGF